MPNQSMTPNQLLAGQASWLRDYRFGLRVDEQGTRRGGRGWHRLDRGPALCRDG